MPKQKLSIKMMKFLYKGGHTLGQRESQSIFYIFIKKHI